MSSNIKIRIFQESDNYHCLQECIPVGCVPPANSPYVYLVRGMCTWSGGVYLVQGGVPGPRGGVPGLGGVSGPGGCTWSWGVYLVPGGGFVPGPGGGGYLVRYSPSPPLGQTHACKHITLPQTSFAGGKNLNKTRNVFDILFNTLTKYILLEYQHVFN